MIRRHALDGKFDVFKWEMQGQFYRLAQELGCLLEYERISTPVGYRRVIIRSDVGCTYAPFVSKINGRPI